MTAYQTISVEPATPRRLWLPAGETLGVRDPEGCQPFALTPEDGRGLEVIASDTDAARVGAVSGPPPGDRLRARGARP